MKSKLGRAMRREMRGVRVSPALRRRILAEAAPARRFRPRRQPRPAALALSAAAVVIALAGGALVWSLTQARPDPQRSYVTEQRVTLAPGQGATPTPQPTPPDPRSLALFGATPTPLPTEVVEVTQTPEATDPLEIFWDELTPEPTELPYESALDGGGGAGMEIADSGGESAASFDADEGYDGEDIAVFDADEGYYDEGDALNGAILERSEADSASETAAIAPVNLYAYRIFPEVLLLECTCQLPLVGDDAPWCASGWLETPAASLMEAADLLRAQSCWGDAVGAWSELWLVNPGAQMVVNRLNINPAAVATQLTAGDPSLPRGAATGREYRFLSTEGEGESFSLLLLDEVWPQDEFTVNLRAMQLTARYDGTSLGLQCALPPFALEPVDLNEFEAVVGGAQNAGGQVQVTLPLEDLSTDAETYTAPIELDGVSLRFTSVVLEDGEVIVVIDPEDGHRLSAQCVKVVEDDNPLAVLDPFYHPDAAGWLLDLPAENDILELSLDGGAPIQMTLGELVAPDNLR